VFLRCQSDVVGRCGLYAAWNEEVEMISNLIL
jgi:hypothetical protein